MNITKFFFVSFCAVASYILPPHRPTHLLQHSVLEHSQSMSFPATSFLFTHIWVLFQRDGSGPLVHKELDGRYTEVGIASFVHASGCGCLTQRSSLESLVTWIGFRQTLSL